LIIGAPVIARVSPVAPPGLPGSSGRPLAIAALIAWLVAASIGVYMLRTWVVRGGLRRQRATGVGVPPAVVFGHAGAAITGLVVWVIYLRTSWHPLAWLGIALIAAAIALGVCTVTLWTPFPVIVSPKGGPGGPQGGSGGPGGYRGMAPPRERGVPGGRPPGPAPSPDAFKVTDEMIASLLADPFPGRRRPRLKLAPLIPVGHGFAALATFMLAMLAAVNAGLGIFSTQ
jgi:hypothetical protein